MTTSPVPSITDELLDELEQKANSATPGSLIAEGATVYSLNTDDVNRIWAQFQPGYTDGKKRTSADECVATAQFVVAANPAAILALIEHTRRLSERLDRMREVARDVLWCIDTGPSCQIGVVERCKCSMCVAGRLRVAIAQEGEDHE